MAFWYKSVETLIDDFFEALKESGSKFAQARKGSRVYFLARAVAVLVSRGYVVLQSLLDAFFVSTSEGDDLRRRVRDDGMEVYDGDYAYGSVIAYAPAGRTPSIAANERFFANDPTLQFRTLQSATLGPVPTMIPIRAIEVGSKHNLSAGTELFSSRADLAGAKFLVSYNLPVNGQPQGDLTGGKDPETDLQIKERYPKFKRSQARAVRFAVDAALRDIPGINLVELRNGVPAPGYFTVLLGNDPSEWTDALRQTLEAALDEWASLGYGYEVRFLEKKTVNVEVNALIGDASVAPAAIAAAIQAIGTLKQGQTLYRSEIVRVGKIAGVSNLTVVSPAADVVADAAQTLKIGTVKVNPTYE